jgi:UDP-3-O-[3-hydroxymyristoyl] glucosamine N-acyltransferase
MNLKTLAGLLKAEFRGPADYEITGLGDVERLKPEDELQDHKVYFIESPAVLKRHPKAAEHGVILTIPALAEQFPRALVVPAADARIALINMLRHFDRAPVFAAGVSPQAHVHPAAKIDPSATVLPGAVVMEGAAIGARCVIHANAVVEPFAVIGEGTVLRANVVFGHHCVIGREGLLHSGTVIGGDGFGFYDQPGKRHKLPHIGNVVIGDHVEIGASSTVDRATIESTRIGDHTKFDDQVHVGHNCQIGRFIYIVGNSAVGGSVVIEDGAMISGMVIVKDHLHVGAGAIVMGMSGVAQDCEPKTAYFGTPARPARQMHKMNAALERLPELIAKVKQLEEKLAGTSPA